MQIETNEEQRRRRAGARPTAMVSQSTNVVLIETEGGLVGIGEGGEPTSMNECASMLIGQDPFRIDQH